MDAVDPDELGRRLGDVYDRIGPLYRRVQRLVELSEPLEDVPIGVRAVLERLDARGAQTVPRIAQALALSRQFVQRSVNDAVERGLVQLEANPAHRRSSLVATTTEGRLRIRAIKAREHRALAGVGGGLTGDDLDGCTRVLDALLAHVAHVELR